MKTYSRFIVASLILTASLWTMSASAQEKSKVTTIKQRPSVVLDTRATRATPTPTPNPRFRFPAKISVERRLPDVFKDRDQQKQEYPRMPGVTGVEVRRAESLVRQTQPNAQISVKEGQYTNNYAPGVVIYHSPERGTFLKPGAEVVLYYNPHQSRLPRMPNLIGMNIAEAEMRLFRAAPRTQSQRILSRRHDPNYGDDAVVAQSPDAGTELSSDVRVVLYVNSQPPLKYPKMPSLIGLDAASAERKLFRAARGFQASRITARRHNPNFGTDIVVSQSLAEGADLTPETQVVISLNPPPPPVLRMPNLIGMDAGAAEEQLQRQAPPSVARRRETASRHDSNYRVGAVVSQSPDAGTELVRGISIVLYVNPQPPIPRMPNLIGLDAETAGNRLRQVAPNVQWRTEQAGTHVQSYPVNVVVSQSPVARTELRTGIEIVLSLNPLPVPKMPNLIGLNGRAAGSKLQTEAPNVPRRFDRAAEHVPGYAVDVVVSQSPSAGTELKLGSSIVLSLNPPPLPKMPNLVGVDPGAAGNRLRVDAPNVQWRMEQAGSHNSGYAVGTVVSQSPSPGTELRAGVQVVLSLNPQPPQKPVQVRVPDVRGLTFAQAKDVIVSLQLTIAPEPNSSGDLINYNVTGQRPQPGELVPVGANVAVTIVPPLPPSSPSPSPSPILVTVPDLENKELAEINRILRAAQLEMGEVTKKDPQKTDSFVLEQKPMAGQQVIVGTRVNMVIGEKPKGWDPIKILGVIATGFGVFFIGKLWKYFRTKSAKGGTGFNTLNIPPDAEPLPTAPALRFHSTMNATSSEFAAATDLQTSFALRFQPRADWGQQYATVNGDLIAAESEEL